MRLVCATFAASIVFTPGAASARSRGGARLYAEACASCHGTELEGQPDWMRPLPSGRMPAPPHDASGHTWHHRDDVLFRLVKEGVTAVVGAATKATCRVSPACSPTRRSAQFLPSSFLAGAAARVPGRDQCAGRCTLTGGQRADMRRQLDKRRYRRRPPSSCLSPCGKGCGSGRPSGRDCRRQRRPAPSSWPGPAPCREPRH